MLPIYGVVAYGVFCVVGRKYMETREAWQWRKVMALWNLSLSVFSIIGVMRTAPVLFYNLATMSFRDNLCIDPRITVENGSCGFWLWLFIMSKFPELLDTFFIVIHKKRPHIFTLVSSYHCTFILLAFICFDISLWHFLCDHELLRSCNHVWLLFSDGS